MTFELLIFDIRKHAQSCFTILNIQGWHLFYLEWNPDKEVEHLEVLGRHFCLKEVTKE